MRRTPTLHDRARDRDDETSRSIIPRRVKLSIIIPVYNEAQTISEVVERVLAVDIGTIEKEVIISNDGSSDGTKVAIDTSRWAGDPRIRRYHNQINLGKGAAVRLGLHYAS